MSLSRAIDGFTLKVGALVSWLILFAILISACNAISRKLFSISSNAWLEAQWYLFGATFLLSAARVMVNDKHVRVDLVFRSLSERMRLWIDLLGHLVFLLPLCVLMLIYGIPFAADSFARQEMSINPGGLIVWPAKILLPLGFALLLAQAVSEIIKRGNGIAEARRMAAESPAAAAPPENAGRRRRTRLSPLQFGAVAALVVLALLLLLSPDGFHDWAVHNMAPIMFAFLVAGLMTGYPIAFSLAAVGLFFGLVGIELDLFRPDFLQAMNDRVYGTMMNETLLAIPFFTFMGLLLQQSGLAEDLLETIGQLFGPMRGGLAYAVVFVGALLAATTGIVAASVISMGLISLPIMLRYGYGQRTATGVIVASGTLAQVIPPSLILIVMADQLGVSVGQMYRAALGPGLMLIAMFALYVFALSIASPRSVPALPEEARGESGGRLSLAVLAVASIALALASKGMVTVENSGTGAVIAFLAGGVFAISVALITRFTRLKLVSELAARVVLILVPPLGLIFLVLGTILVGLATPTEGGALGAVGTMLLAGLSGRANWTSLKSVVLSTAELSTFVIFILVGARVFSLTFYGVDGHIWVEELLLGLPGGELGFLVFVSALIFVLGFVLDFYEIAFILLPLLVIPAESLGIDLVWFGILLAINLQTSFMSPPFGFSLFFLRSVAPTQPYKDKTSGKTIPGISTPTIYLGVLPFIAINLLLIVIVAVEPDIIRLFDRETVNLDASAVEDELNSLPSIGIEGLGPLSFD